LVTPPDRINDNIKLAVSAVPVLVDAEILFTCADNVAVADGGEINPAVGFPNTTPATNSPNPTVATAESLMVIPADNEGCVVEFELSDAWDRNPPETSSVMTTSWFDI
jgi:hypothetical protein